MKTIIALIIALFSGVVSAEEKLGITIGIHCCSDHTPDPAKQANNDNPGLFIRFGNGLGFGMLRNSLKQESVHIDYTTDEYYRLRATMGAMSGYRMVSGREWVPFYMISARLFTLEGVDLLLGYTTDGSNELKHFMLSRRF